MTNFQYSNKQAFNTLISIESLNIHNKQTKYNYLSKSKNTQNNTIEFNKNIHTKHKAFWSIGAIVTANQILKITNQESQKIISILKDNSNRNQRYTSKKRSLLSKQYIKRFTYKYLSHQKHNFKNTEGIDRQNARKTNLVSMTYLYTIYKIMRTRNKFMAYKYFNKYNSRIY